MADLREELYMSRERQQALREQLLDEYKAECQIQAKCDKAGIKVKKEGASEKTIHPGDVQIFFRRQGVHISK